MAHGPFPALSPARSIFIALQLLRWLQRLSRGPECLVAASSSRIGKTASQFCKVASSPPFACSSHPATIPKRTGRPPVAWPWSACLSVAFGPGSQSPSHRRPALVAHFPGVSVARPVFWMPFLDILQSAQRVLWKSVYRLWKPQKRGRTELAGASGTTESSPFLSPGKKLKSKLLGKIFPNWR